MCVPPIRRPPAQNMCSRSGLASLGGGAEGSDSVYMKATQTCVLKFQVRPSVEAREGRVI